MLADRVRMGAYSEELPIYLFESGTDSYLNWDMYSHSDFPDSSYATSDFLEIFSVPIMDWYGQATYKYPINKGNRNWLEVTFSHGQPGPPFSEPETLLFDISEFTDKTITRLRFFLGDTIRLEGDMAYHTYRLGLEVPPGEALGVRLYSMCLK